MYEFTHGGLWFDWNALDPVSRRLAGASLAAAAVAGALLGVMAAGGSYDLGYRLGYWLASGGEMPKQAYRPIAVAAWVVWSSLALLVTSGLLWWRFSLRQDELFNRIQNWALGMSGAWTGAVLAGWALLSLGGIVAPVAPLPLIVGFWCAAIAFWMIAVRRWA